MGSSAWYAWAGSDKSHRVLRKAEASCEISTGEKSGSQVRR